MSLSALALFACATPQTAPKVTTPSATSAASLDLKEPAAPPFTWGDHDLRQVPADKLYYTALSLQEDGELEEALQLMYYAQAANHGDALSALARLNASAGRTDDALYWLKRAASDEGLVTDDVTEDEAFSAMMSDARWPLILDYIAKKHEEFTRSAIRKVEVVVPRGYDASKPIPVIVGLHGYRSSPKAFVSDMQPLADELFAAFVGVSGTIPYGPNSFAWSEDPTRDAAHVREALASVRDKVQPAPGLLTFGFSQGALAAAELVAFEPETFDGALVLSPGGDASAFSALQSPPAMLNKRVLVVMGDSEHPETLAQGHALARWFSVAGGGAYVRETEDQEAHVFPQDFAQRFPGWASFLWGEELAPKDVTAPLIAQPFGVWADDDALPDAELGPLRGELFLATGKIFRCLQKTLDTARFAAGMVVTQIDVDAQGRAALSTSQNTTEQESAAACMRDVLAEAKKKPRRAGRYYVGYAISWANPTGAGDQGPWPAMTLKVTRTADGPDQAALDVWLERRRPLVASCLRREVAREPDFKLDAKFELRRPALSRMDVTLRGVSSAYLERCLHDAFTVPDGLTSDWKNADLALGSLTLAARAASPSAPSSRRAEGQARAPLRFEADASSLRLTDIAPFGGTDDGGLEITDTAQLRPYGEVWKVMAPVTQKLQRCVDRLPAREVLDVGPFELELQVEKSGKIFHSELAPKQPERLRDCILAEVKRLKFPAIKSDRVVTVALPIAVRATLSADAARPHRTRLPKEPEPAQKATVEPAAQSDEPNPFTIIAAMTLPSAERVAMIQKAAAALGPDIVQEGALTHITRACVNKAADDASAHACGLIFMVATVIKMSDAGEQKFAEAQQACASGNCLDLAAFELLGIRPLKAADRESALAHFRKACDDKQQDKEEAACVLHAFVRDNP